MDRGLGGGKGKWPQSLGHRKAQMIQRTRPRVGVLCSLQRAGGEVRQNRFSGAPSLIFLETIYTRNWRLEADGCAGAAPC